MTVPFCWYFVLHPSVNCCNTLPSYLGTCLKGEEETKEEGGEREEEKKSEGEEEQREGKEEWRERTEGGKKE